MHTRSINRLNNKAALERDTIIKLIIAVFIIAFAIWLIAKSGAITLEWFE